LSNQPKVLALLAQIEGALRPLADAQQAQPMRAYMLDQFVFLGVHAPPRRQALLTLPGLKDWTAPALLALAEVLWVLPEREFQYAAVDLLAKYHRQLDLQSLPRLIALVQRKSWWDSVDALAGVVGDILLLARKQGHDGQHTMDSCLGHSNLWVRRVAMLHQLGWKERTDESRLLRYALHLAGEPDFFIRKAIGWALRDYARTRPDVVRAFLAQHGQTFSGLTRREAGKHLG
jgi:3-methyladenine DNA glycosylase AlkD